MENYSWEIFNRDNFNVFIRDLSSSVNTNLKHMIEDLDKEDSDENKKDNKPKKMKKKDTEIRRQHLAWYFKKTDCHDFIKIRVADTKTVDVRLRHEIKTGVSFAKIGKKVISVFEYPGTETTSYHHDNLMREASYQLGIKAFLYLHDA